MAAHAGSQSGVPFAFFCSLVREISKIQPAPIGRSVTSLDHPAQRVFHRWNAELHRRFTPLPLNTTTICFRLLFPEEDIRRKYDIQEARMTRLLADSYGMDLKSFESWGQEEATGCLGQELKLILERRAYQNHASQLSILDIDLFLDELASKSAFSSQSIRISFSSDSSRTRGVIMQSVFQQLTPEEASILTQIVLKDLRPLLYPLSEYHYTTALTRFNTASVKMLSKEQAMAVWDRSGGFLKYYRVSPDIEAAAAYADLPISSRPKVHPAVGKPLTIPKSEKGRGCVHALSHLADSERVWAETKYDGERAQIHVELNRGGPQITIFSKSKRDSTLDRHIVHSIILSALGLGESLPFPENAQKCIWHSVILDAEMVPFRGQTIEEFWRIRSLIEETAYGVRQTLNSGIECADRHSNNGISLGLVFFDVMFLDSKSLMSRPYSERRQILEGLINTLPGRCMLSKRFLVDMGLPEPSRGLAKIFAHSIARGEEGLILKAEESKYNDYTKPWVKIKRDYVPDAGDKLDLVILGASWEKCRGRSLRVPPSTYTTFFIGALSGVERGRVVESKQRSCSNTVLKRLRFYLYFSVSYGLARDDLEKLNFAIKSSDPLPYSSAIFNDLPFDLEVLVGLNPLPAVILRTPLLVSLYGAGFTKASKSKQQHYELRFPRISRYYLPNERGWQDAPFLEDIQQIALRSMGRDRKDKDIVDWAKTTWGQMASPMACSHTRRRETADVWENLLVHLDGNEVSHSDPSIVLSNKHNASSLGGPDSCKTDPTPPLTSVTTSVVSDPTPSKIEQPWSLLAKSSHVWFARPSEPDYVPCLCITHRRKQITRERRLHCLDSLLMVGGVIVVDECVERTGKWLDLIKKRLASIAPVPKIILYTCRSDDVVAIIE